MAKKQEMSTIQFDNVWNGCAFNFNGKTNQPLEIWNVCERRKVICIFQWNNYV